MNFLRHPVLALAWLGLSTAPALAHAFLIKAEPAVGSTVHPAPKILILSYTEALEIPFCSVTVTDGMGMNDAASRPQAVPDHPNEMQVKLNITMPGKISVAWHALSVDTHKTQGSFSFTVD